MSQNDWILQRLKAGYALTAMDALKGCGCFRLAARINDLRAAGHNILTEKLAHNNKTFASYRLARRKS